MGYCSELIHEKITLKNNRMTAQEKRELKDYQDYKALDKALNRYCRGVNKRGGVGFEGKNTILMQGEKVRIKIWVELEPLIPRPIKDENEIPF